MGRSRGGLTTKIHLVTTSDRAVVTFSLSGGNAHNAPEGLRLLERFERQEGQRYLLMGWAYEGEEVRANVRGKGFLPVVPPKRNRENPWEYDKEWYTQRNEIERCMLRLKWFRRIFIRYDKLDIISCGFFISP